MVLGPNDYKPTFTRQLQALTDYIDMKLRRNGDLLIVCHLDIGSIMGRTVAEHSNELCRALEEEYSRVGWKYVLATSKQDEDWVYFTLDLRTPKPKEKSLWSRFIDWINEVNTWHRKDGE